MNPVRIVPYDERHIPLVTAFNQRILGADAGFQFPEHVESHALPRAPGRRIYQEYFVAYQEPEHVRGGYILKSQPCSYRGEIAAIGNYQLPLSEGIVAKEHGMVGVQLLLDAIRKQPRLYSLGMGGIDRALPQMLKKMGWRTELVPFFFRVLNGPRFLRNISFLRNKPKFRLGADVLYWSGTGYLGAALLNAMTALPRWARLLRSGVRTEVVTDFGAWADEVWNEAAPHYGLLAGRDTETLRILYPSSTPRFTRLRVFQAEKTLGWALVLSTPMTGHKQFGNMRVGTLADCLALPGFEQAVVDHATRYLESTGADILVSNQSHERWVRAMKGARYLSGPSNYGFAGSPALMKGIASLAECHLTRGDGDGPINL